MYLVFFYSICIDENRYDRSYFRYVVDHKDIIRATTNLANGLMLYKHDVDDFLMVSNKL